MFKRIYLESEHIHRIDLPKAFGLLDQTPQMPIYITIRDPRVRFQGGLHTTSLNSVGLYPTDDPITQAAGFLACLRTLALYGTIPVTTAPPMKLGGVPYHLHDIHLAHILWRPLLLLAYGYNVCTIPLGEYTKFLLGTYGEFEHIILDQHRDNSDKVANDQNNNLFWQAYSRVFRTPEYAAVLGFTWGDWINPECEIYQFLDQQDQKTPAQAQQLIDNLIRGSFYFADLITPANKPLEELLSMLYSRRGVYDRLWSHRQQAYSDTVKRIPEPNTAIYGKQFPSA